MKLQTVKLSQVKPNPDNPRIIKDKDFADLVKSIKDFPEMMEAREIVVNTDMMILGGNQRYKALQDAGVTETTVKVVDWPETKQREFVIKDNVQKGEHDWDRLANEWDAEELDAWGLEFPDVWQEEAEVEEDEAPEVSDETPVSELGKIYQLGRHRVMCGDSTDFGQVSDLLDGTTPALLFTDPPYKLETSGGKKGSIGKSLRTQGQSIDFISDFEPQTMLGILPDLFSGNKFNACIFTNKELLPDYLSWAKAQKYAFNILVWKKPNAIPIGSDYKPDTEYIVFIRKNATWNTSVSGANYSRVFESDRESGLHPTMKPQKIIVSCLKVSSNSGDTVLDLFLGSGSTLIACEQTDRTCYGMELDPRYVDVIRKRYAKHIEPETWEESWQTLTPAIN